MARPVLPSCTMAGAALWASAVGDSWCPTTAAPSSASRSATARPRRFADPVTRATRPARDSPLFADDMIGNDTTAYKLQTSREFIARPHSARVPTTPSPKLLESAEPSCPLNPHL